MGDARSLDAADDRTNARRRWGLDKVPDHFAATADELRYIAGKIDAGTSPQDIAQRVINLGRIMARGC